MINVEECPHCRERTEVEQPDGEFGGPGETVEYEQPCNWCGESLVARFRVEYVLVEVTKD